MSLKAVLFDVDGTLADTEALGHRPAYNRAFRNLGLDFRWGPKLYRKLLRQPGGRERIKHYLQHYQPELGAETAEVEQNLDARSEEHTSELQSLMRISYAVFCLKTKKMT